MATKIFNFNQYKHIEFIKLQQQEKTVKFDALLHINNLPFVLKDVSITGIKKDKIRYEYESIYHKRDLNKEIDICPFCRGNFDNSICSELTKEKDKLFTEQIGNQLFFPIMSYYYNKTDEKFIKSMVEQEIEEFEALFFGMSNNTYIQCIFRYKGEILLFQDVLNATSTDVLPLIFYFNPEFQKLHLYIEYLLPKNLISITSAINTNANQPGVQIFNTTGIDINDLYINFINENNLT